MATFTVAVTSSVSLNGFLFAGEMHLVHYNTKVCTDCTLYNVHAKWSSFLTFQTSFRPCFLKKLQAASLTPVENLPLLTIATNVNLFNDLTTDIVDTSGNLPLLVSMTMVGHLEL
jgi:hypothetical protein